GLQGTVALLLRRAERAAPDLAQNNDVAPHVGCALRLVYLRAAAGQVDIERLSRRLQGGLTDVQAEVTADIFWKYACFERRADVDDADHERHRQRGDVVENEA